MHDLCLPALYYLKSDVGIKLRTDQRREIGHSSLRCRKHRLRVSYKKISSFNYSLMELTECECTVSHANFKGYCLSMKSQTGPWKPLINHGHFEACKLPSRMQKGNLSQGPSCMWPQIRVIEERASREQNRGSQVACVKEIWAPQWPV